MTKRGQVIEVPERVRAAIHDVLRSGEFAAWLREQEMPFAAARELDELRAAYVEWCRITPGRCFCGVHRAELLGK